MKRLVIHVYMSHELHIQMSHELYIHLKGIERLVIRTLVHHSPRWSDLKYLDLQIYTVFLCDLTGFLVQMYLISHNIHPTKNSLSTISSFRGLCATLAMSAQTQIQVLCGSTTVTHTTNPRRNSTSISNSETNDSNSGTTTPKPRDECPKRTYLYVEFVTHSYVELMTHSYVNV